MLGDAISLNCEAEGYPKPEISWFKNNTEGKSSKEFKSIQLRNNSLTVDYVTDADEGYYMCTANNGIGAGLKKIIHINVNGKLRTVYTIHVYDGFKLNTPHKLLFHSIKCI